jgi:hypothetical protein
MIFTKARKPNTNSGLSEENFSDASHPVKRYTEWWYFNFFYNKNDAVAGIFKIENNVPEIWIFIKEKGKKEIYQRRKFKFKKFKASTKHCDTEIAGNYFREKNGRYEIKINFGSVKLDVKFKNNYDWPDNKIYRDIGRGQKIFWICPCVRGKVSGTLEFDGEKKYISGIIFHDHVWHNIGAISIYRDFKGWFWGVNYYSDGFSLYADVDLGRRGDYRFFFSDRGGKRLKVVDDPELQFKKGKAMREIDIVYKKKVLHRIALDQRTSIYQWGTGRIIKFIVHRLLGLSQYHCLGTEKNVNTDRDYIEILQKG